MNDKPDASEILAEAYIKDLIEEHADIDQLYHFVNEQFATDAPAMMVVREGLSVQSWAKVNSAYLRVRWERV